MTSALNKIIIAQFNYTVGDIEGNCEKIIDAYRQVEDENALLVCSELALTGYYPQDLVSKESVLARQDEGLRQLTAATKGKACGLVVGYLARNHQPIGKKLFNALALLSDGKQVFEYHKRLLPTYNIFDEARHFCPGSNQGIFEWRGKNIGFLICEDAWASTDSLQYAEDPVVELKKHQLDFIIDINASPNNLGKIQERLAVVSRVARTTETPVVYVNQVGGNDELVFDGASFVVNARGKRGYQMKAFEEQIGEVDLATIDSHELEQSEIDKAQLTDAEMALKQTVLGIRDYVRKCGFSQVVIGASGGIDSALTLAICSQALGSDNVTAITMPSKFSSKGSVDDSEALCTNLGVKLLTSSIAEEFELAVKRFQLMTGEVPSGLTQENMQARIRGRILMEYSNHYGALVVSTGNKSEMSVGYATLYGDMNGGVNPLGDLYKMEVYEIARLFNQQQGKAIIPQQIIDKAPSAELAADQRDSDSLPEYPLLDAILKLYIEGDLLTSRQAQQCRAVIQRAGADEALIEGIHRMVDRAEFKRRQAPLIIRVQKRSFGKGRWLPVAAKY